MTFVLIVGLVCLTNLLAAAEPVERSWVGELRIGDVKHFVVLTVSDEGPQVNGTITYPASGGNDIPLSSISFEPDHTTFAWTGDDRRLSFDGNLTGDLPAGTVRADSTLGTLQLARTAKLDPAAEQRLIGYYEVAPGHVLSVTKYPLGMVSLDYTTGRAGVLFPSSQTSFWGGPSFQVPVPVTTRCRLSTDPTANLVALHCSDASGNWIGRKLSPRSEEVTFKNGDITLSGTLVLPDGAGPHPAIVRVQGSGPQTRRNSADGWFASHGVAYLSFDKRGAGKSTGDWRDAGISELADDVLAGVRLLRQRADIDPNQIGIEGDSEGGWIAPVVATRDPKIAFIVLHAGPALDYVGELLNEAQANLEANGVSGDDLNGALTFQRHVLAMLADGAGLSDDSWAKLQAFVAPYRSERWFRYVAVPKQRNWSQKKLYLMAQIKSPEFWRQVKIPVLALYGGHDLNVPAARNVAALTQELRAAGNRDFEVKLFATANHDGLDTPQMMMSDEQLRYVVGFAPGYLDTQLNWVLAHVTIRRGS